MKRITLMTVISIVLLGACNSNSKQPNTNSDTAQSTPATSTETAIQPQPTSPVKEIVSGYLQLKNALASDNDKDAATAGNTMVAAFGQFDKSALSAEKKKSY